ncbi:proprotein convertase subtilisin/kexin type 4 isoform X1 [Ornithorhynchus anatinus]|uniref:Proprotein convertase subtilisin/kexin type 4 n=1 Tax=Ornithorhynchus anatinus TaxID=9258 RepID=A0A6I8PGU8_ORNAN|nr:proprotein convertase subtilisin/kexin type 4 isoform X1 [Ornithorhynchus anatinus]
MRSVSMGLAVAVAVALAMAVPVPVPRPKSEGRVLVYLRSWAVRVPEGTPVAERLAHKLGFVYMGQVFEGGQYYEFQHRGIASKSLNQHWGHRLRLMKEPKIYWFEQQVLKHRVKRDTAMKPTDPWFSKQWYLNRDIQPDLNVLTAWSKGYTGQGIVVSILDDGLEWNHPDLMGNYDPLASYDFNSNDPDPRPQYGPLNENRHGTRCAGEVAAIANNGICGVGIAFNARIGGVRMLDGIVTDLVEAQSLALQPQHIDIYSASWGPEDDGRMVDGPGFLVIEAFSYGVTMGRAGLGNLFIWASGNGGLQHDNCNCDGYTNSIYTLSVGSVTQHGTVPWYSEACASILTTTYSSGTLQDQQIVTTDLRKQCTDKHTGTSASAPLAAGIIALALEANPALTWRDMHHLVVRSSSPAHLQADDWALNGVGRKVSHHFGYGLLDAGVLVQLATEWKMSQPQRKCLIKMVDKALPIHSTLHISKNISACAGGPFQLRSLEHVQVKLTLSYSRRGDLEISLTSPMGTRSILVAIRPFDISDQGYMGWTFMSTHFWDERPQGVWTLELDDKGYFYNSGVLHSVILLLYGTDEDMAEQILKTSMKSACMQQDTEGLCQECTNPHYSFGHLCLAYCPPHYTPVHQGLSSAGRQQSSLERICATYHPSCYTCQSNLTNNCTTCPAHFVFNGPAQSSAASSYASNWIKPQPMMLVMGVCGGPLVVMFLLYIIYQLICLMAEAPGPAEEPNFASPAP